MKFTRINEKTFHENKEEDPYQLTQVNNIQIPIKKIQTGYISAKGSREAARAGPTVLHTLQLTHYMQVVLSCVSPDMTPLIARWYTYRDKAQVLKNKLFRTNKGSNYVNGSFHNRTNLRTPIQFERGRQSKHLKKIIFIHGMIETCHFLPLSSVFQVRFTLRSQLELLPEI